MSNKVDTLFSKPKVNAPFSFDKQVAEVFPDMIKRSVPGYSEIIQNLSLLANRFIQPNTQCYDLGCSLGAVSLAISEGNQSDKVKIIAIDNSQAMLQRCQQHINAFKHNTLIELHQADILTIKISNASMVVLNFTLQFIPQSERETLLQNIYDGLNDGGILVLSEKICFKNKQINNLMTQLHHQFKKDNGYSELEISQKRNALENVLLPETKHEHISRLEKIGFSNVCCWFNHYNFASFLAIK